MKHQLHTITIAITLLILITAVLVNTGSAQQYWNTAHYANWDMDNNTVPYANLPWQYITHMIIFAGGTGGSQTNGTSPYYNCPADLNTGSGGAASDSLIKYARKYGVHVELDLGLGQGWANLWAAGDAALQVWASTVAHIIVNKGYDGCDYDLEGFSPYPSTTAGHTHNKLYDQMKYLHDTLAALAPGKKFYQTCDILSGDNLGSGGLGIAAAVVDGYLDQVNPMWYDQCYPEPSPLYHSSTHSCWSNDSALAFSEAAAIQAAGATQAFARAHAGIGYAIQVYTGCNTCYAYLSQQASHLTSPTAVINFDNESKERWLTDGSYSLAYEDSLTGYYKADFIKRYGFGGAMGFSIGYGYLPNPPVGWNHNPAVVGLGKNLLGNSPPPPADTIPPVVHLLTPPASGDSVSGSVTLTATATDNVGVSRVDFLVNGTVVATDATTPYTGSWNTTGLVGQQTITARAYDAAGNTAITPSVIVYVKTAADTIPPVVHLSTPPASGDSVSGSVTLTATATDNVGVSRVDFLVNGTVVATDATTPYTGIWNTTGLVGQQTITARAYDAKGNNAITPGVIVYIKTAPPALPATPVLATPTNGATNQSTSPVLNWNSSTGSTSYHVQVATTSSFSPMLVDDSSITTTSRQLSSLTAATTYYWRASAKNSAGSSAYSSAWSFTVASTPPPAGQSITGFTLVQLNGTPIAGFDPISNGAILSLKHLPTGFAIRANTNPSPVGSVHFTSPGTRNDNIAPYSYPRDNSGTFYQWVVTAGQNYTITAAPYTVVNARGTMGTGLSITVSVLADTTSTTLSPPSAPVLVAPANSSSNQATTLTLSWNASIGATSYTVQVSANNNFSSFVVNDSTITAPTRSVSGLTNGAMYYWRVNAKNNVGTSTYSTVWSFTTAPSSSSSDLWVYQDAFLTPWSDYSWGATNVLLSTEHVYAGSFALKSTQTAWGAISSYSSTGVNPSLYSSMSFLVYPTTAGLGFYIFLQSDQSSTTLPTVIIPSSNLPLNQWTVVTIPLSQLDPTNLPINRINIQNSGGSPTFFLDNLRFVGGAASSMQTMSVQAEKIAVVASGPAIVLEQNSPNPFNPTTNFTFRIANPEHVVLKIYDMIGREVATLVDDAKPAGEYTVQWNASTMASGVYFYRLTSGRFTAIKKLMLLK
jgi:hypothetical protein